MKNFDHEPKPSPTSVDEAKARLAEIDADIEAITYLDEFGGEANRAFSFVQEVVDSIQSGPPLTPTEIANRFEQDVMPTLHSALDKARMTKPNDHALATLHALAIKALDEDASAFQHLVAAYRHQDRDKLARGRALREQSAIHRRDWMRSALELGQSVGLYDAAPDTTQLKSGTRHPPR